MVLVLHTGTPAHGCANLERQSQVPDDDNIDGDSSDSDSAAGKFDTDGPDDQLTGVQRRKSSVPMMYTRLVPNSPVEGETVSVARRCEEVGPSSFLHEHAHSGHR